MQYRSWKYVILAALLCLLTGLTAACEKGADDAAVDVGEVVIPALFLVNPETGVADNKDLVEDFNKAYAGRYRIEVEWMTETVEGYRARLKQLNAQDKLPALITDVGMDEDFYRLLVDNDRLVDLSAYMDAEWTAMINEDVLADCTETDGAIYMSPIVSPVYSFAGIIYNRQMLAQAGYAVFPEDWDGFFACLEALRENWVTPLALHGGGTYWSPMVLATAYCGRNGAGARFLDQQFPQDYDTAAMEDLLYCLDKIYDYTYPDALAVDYATAQTRFYNGSAAMLINGYWVLETMDERQQSQFGFAPFPGNVMVVSPKMTAWAATTGYSEDVTRGVVELLRYRVVCSKENSEAFMASEGTPIEQDYKTAVRNVRRMIPNYQLKWEQAIQNEFFNEYMPAFINDEMTADEFIRRLNEAAQKIHQEKTG